MQWIWVNWWIQMSPNVPSTRQKSGKERVREKVKRKESRFSFFCRRLQLLTRFDWYGIRSYSIKQRFTLHRFLLKNLKASKLFIDVCSNLHLAKVDWCCVCVCVCGWRRRVRRGMAGASAAPRGTCFPCALVHLPVFSNGAQQGGMNRPESGNAAVKLHRGGSACTGLK